MQGEKSKRESSPWLKRKRKSPGLKTRTIQSRKQRKFGSLLVSTLLDVFLSDALTTELLETLRRARLKCGFKSHLGLGFFRLPSGFHQQLISYIYIILIFANHVFSVCHKNDGEGHCHFSAHSYFVRFSVVFVIKFKRGFF